MRNYSANALVRIGPDAVEPLIEALEGESYYQRGFAAWTLGRLGPGQGTVPPLMKLLDDDVVFVKEMAIEALVEIGPEAKLALGKLRFLAEHDSTMAVQIAAKEAVERLSEQ